MNILGEAFDDYVKKQIEVRQKVLGKIKNITEDELKFYTNKAPWCRLASSTILTNIYPDLNETIPENVLDKLVKYGFPKELIQEDQLKKNFILQGGATGLMDEESKLPLKYGLNTNNQLFSGAYGWGGINERGFVPMPGITGAAVQFYQNGAFAKAVINIKAFSKNQLQLIDVLFMRPGYSALLEWGWSVYLDNEGKLKTPDGWRTKPLNYILDPTSGTNDNQFYMAKIIADERKNHFGNYDATYGKVTKFSWQFNKDGSYDIVINLIGMGDILESLKVNLASPGAKTTDKSNVATDGTENTAEEPLAANKDKTSMNKALWQASQIAKGGLSGKDPKIHDLNLKNVLSKVKSPVSGSGNITSSSVPEKFGLKSFVVKNGLMGIPEVCTDEAGHDDTGLGKGQACYIKFGAMLCLLETLTNLYTKKDTAVTPMISFDFNYEDLEKDENYMFHCPTQFSANPAVCLVPYVGVNIEELKAEVTMPSCLIQEKLKNSGYFTENVFLARLANVYVNMNFLAIQLQTHSSETDATDGGISVLTFLNNVLNGISLALGSQNNFRVMLDNDTYEVKIYDETPQKFDILPSNGLLSQEKYTTLNVFGVNTNTSQGSIVKDINLNSELSANFATLISVGAQIRGAELNANATAFSKYSAGLVDSVLPTKVEYSSALDTKDGKTNLQKAQDNFNNNIHNKTGAANGGFPNSNLQTIYGWYDFTSSVVTSMQDYLAQQMDLIVGILCEGKQEIHSPFFLPFNLSLTLDGISGIRIYQKFYMTEDILPPSYSQANIDLVIKSVNHTISPTTWEVQLETIAAPRNPNIKPSTPGTALSAGLSSNPPTTGPASSTPAGPVQYFEAKMPANPKTRLVLTRLIDDGVQTLGCFDILAEDEKTVLYSLASVELPWKDNTNMVSCIPAGKMVAGLKYAITSRANTKYGPHFYIVGHEKTAKGWRIPGAKNADRQWCLIHRSPIAPGWLQGCIGPGPKFNMKQKYSNGNPKGVGTKYLTPAREESYDALQKMVGSLHALGGFYMVVKCLNPKIKGGTSGAQPDSTKFSDASVQNFIKGKNLI